MDGSIGQDEIADFHRGHRDCKPKSGVQWLENYLAAVKTIYAFQHLQGSETVDGSNALHALRSALVGARRRDSFRPTAKVHE